MSSEQEFIKEFLTKIATQDNRSTAAPYFYVIRDKVEVPAFEGCGDIVKYYDPENAEYAYDSVEDYIAAQKENAEYDSMLKVEKREFDARMENVKYNLSTYELKHDWVEKGMFLTEDDAKDHIKRNSYHYTEHAHTYVKHAWRAPELEKFFVALFRHFNIDKGNLDIRLNKYNWGRE